MTNEQLDLLLKYIDAKFFIQNAPLPANRTAWIETATRLRDSLMETTAPRKDAMPFARPKRRAADTRSADTRSATPKADAEFKRMWSASGRQYGTEELANVKLGWDMAQERMARLEVELDQVKINRPFTRPRVLTEYQLSNIWNYEASKSGHNTHELPARFFNAALEAANGFTAWTRRRDEIIAKEAYKWGALSVQCSHCGGNMLNGKQMPEGEEDAEPDISELNSILVNADAICRDNKV